MNTHHPTEYITLKSGKNDQNIYNNLIKLYLIVLLITLKLKPNVFCCFFTTGIKENYSLFYSKRSSDMSKCENGKGSVDESIQYGTTRFEKIRLNINSMQVMEDDYIFAQITGKPQQFASGGDCYSNSGSCPQGDFFVNLEGTGFRIRPSTTWETSGANSTIGFQIRVNIFIH